MNKLDNNKMQLVCGGGLTSQFLNALTKAITLLYNLGQSVGSSIKRATSGINCPVA